MLSLSRSSCTISGPRSCRQSPIRRAFSARAGLLMGRVIAALTSDSRSIVLYDLATQKWSNWYSTSEGMVSFPDWSRDSGAIYFLTAMTDHPSMRRLQLGSQVAETVADLTGEHRYGDRWGSWSGVAADGSVLFVRDASTQEIYALDVDLP